MTWTVLDVDKDVKRKAETLSLPLFQNYFDFSRFSMKNK